jgi:hypothetical protein
MIDERYARQILLPEIGEAGQQTLLRASALVVGCGGLGSTLLYCLSVWASAGSDFATETPSPAPI